MMISFTGCNNVEIQNQLNKYGIQPPIEKLYWGMTTPEIEEALLIRDGVEGVIYDQEEYGETSITIPNKFEKFGYNVTVRLEIVGPPKLDWIPYKTESLTTAKLFFSNIDKSDLQEKLSKEFGEDGLNWTNSLNYECTTWESKDKASNLKSKELDKLKNYWKTLSEHSGEYSPAKEKSVNDRINKVILSINPQGTDAILTYEGNTAIVINKICLSKD